MSRASAALAVGLAGRPTAAALRVIDEIRRPAEGDMRKLVLASMLMMVMTGGWAFAESTRESLGGPGYIECEAFKQNRNGSWTSVRKSVVTIGSNRLSVDGTTFERQGTKQTGVTINVFVGSNDLADVLDRTCR
jgi:hypothetical protein